MVDTKKLRNIKNTSKLGSIKRVLKKIDNQIIVQRRIHKGFEEFNKLSKKHTKGLICHFGKYQYIYTCNKGKISLIKLVASAFRGGRILDDWEIYELSQNNLFDGVERFKTKKEAEKRIKELLE